MFLNHWSDWLLPRSPNDVRLFHSDSSDRILVCSPHLGQGYIQEIQLREDLSLRINDYTLHQDLVIDVPGQSNILEFIFPLTSSDARYSYVDPHFGLNSFTIKLALKRVFKLEVFFQRPSLITYFQAFREHLSPQTRSVAEQLTQYLSEYFGTSRSSPDETLSQLLQGEITLTPDIKPQEILPNPLYSEIIAFNYSNSSPRTPAMEQVIGQILSCPYQGATRRTYLKRKVLELTNLRLEMMTKPHLREADFDYIYEAASILRKQIINPPTVETLARQVGTNRLYLNQGFHQVYGTTPFGYSGDCRMWQAQRLLMISDLPVGKIAAVVGYTNCSHFARAFRQYTGLNPKTFQMKAWQYFS